MSTSSSPLPTQRNRPPGLALRRPRLEKMVFPTRFPIRQATELVVKGAALSRGMHVLDLAAGSGEPALSVSAAVGPEGRVTATDLLREMLQIAEENASARGIKTSTSAPPTPRQLPFPRHMFDRITCRFGIMFVPNIQKPSAKCVASSNPAAASPSSPGAPWKRIHSSAR